MKKLCEEWTVNMKGEPVQMDSHKWIEIINNERIQTLKCEVCGKHSTGKKDYFPTQY